MMEDDIPDHEVHEHEEDIEGQHDDEVEYIKSKRGYNFDWSLVAHLDNAIVADEYCNNTNNEHKMVSILTNCCFYF